MKKIITVDGPAGSGKEKISRYIARKYKLYHLDSGLLYRRLAYELEKKNIKTFQVSKIKSVIKNVKKLSLRKTKVLRKEEIGKAASEILVKALGFGFMEREDKEKDAFVHASAVKAAGMRFLNEGDKLEFTLEDGPKGPSAVNLKKID